MRDRLISILSVYVHGCRLCNSLPPYYVYVCLGEFTSHSLSLSHFSLLCVFLHVCYINLCVCVCSGCMYICVCMYVLVCICVYVIVCFSGSTGVAFAEDLNLCL